MTADERKRVEENVGNLAPVVWFLALVAGGWVVPQTPASNIILCPMLALTDILCPGCGMTRSVTAFVRADVEASVLNHVFGPILMLGLAWVSMLRVGDRVAKKPVLEPLRLWWARWSTPVYLTVLPILLGYWAARLAGWIPEPL